VLIVLLWRIVRPEPNNVTTQLLDPAVVIRILAPPMTRAGAFLVFPLLLVPTAVPRGLDTAQAPLRAVSFNVWRSTVPPRTTLGALLAGVLSPAAVHALVEVARPSYDLARLTVGQPFGLTTTAAGELHAFTYAIDAARTLRVSRAGDGSSLQAEVMTRDYTTRVATVGGVITSSLFLAVTSAGEDDQLALDLASVFAWDVDFNTEIQRGDSYRVAVEKLSVEDRFVRYGRILAAEFRRGERVRRAVRFDGDRSAGYYAPDGTPLRKAFLRSPLTFSRITSGFSHARLHPILNVTQPHLGVDYAASVGTPVLAAGRGLVVSAGWQGGYGQSVRLRHSNGFETLYGHLSRIDVAVGQRVDQGARLGAVGMTGLATGPHLDYRMTRDGRFVDPLRIPSPPADPLAADERVDFEAIRERRLPLLEPEDASLVATR
jgi:murein DD-endopeptidase MepM/ murein hydrolase activator NlpD